MLWFNFILGLIFSFLCFKLFIIHYHIQEKRKLKIKPRIKLNQNIYLRPQLNTATKITSFLFFQSVAKIAKFIQEVKKGPNNNSNNKRVSREGREERKGFFDLL